MKNDLLNKYNEFIEIPFPQDLEDDALYYIIGELAEYDGYIAGLISSYANGKEENKAKIIYDKSFEERVYATLEENPELKVEAEKILNYLEKIKELVYLVHSS